MIVNNDTIRNSYDELSQVMDHFDAAGIKISETQQLLIMHLVAEINKTKKYLLLKLGE